MVVAASEDVVTGELNKPHCSMGQWYVMQTRTRTFVAGPMTEDEASENAAKRNAIRRRKRQARRQSAFDRQIEKARHRFGETAIVGRESTIKHDSGLCTTCGDRSCRRRWRYFIGVDTGRGISVRGQGHTWDRAWADVERREEVSCGH